mmetsp:Transcript_18177/g.57760  ORF Transcript_18177/g.57760 Transcript_18177/m.57760 type:complete len:208 (-) Transcript_18177:1210-1833(-)
MSLPCPGTRSLTMGGTLLQGARNHLLLWSLKATPAKQVDGCWKSLNQFTTAEGKGTCLSWVSSHVGDSHAFSSSEKMSSLGSLCSKPSASRKTVPQAVLLPNMRISCLSYFQRMLLPLPMCSTSERSSTGSLGMGFRCVTKLARLLKVSQSTTLFGSTSSRRLDLIVLRSSQYTNGCSLPTPPRPTTCSVPMPPSNGRLYMYSPLFL